MASPWNVAAWQPARLRASPRAVGFVTLVTFGGLIAVGVLLVVRRLSYVFTGDLPWPLLMAIAAALATVVLTLRTSWRALHPLAQTGYQPTWLDEAIGWGGSTVILTWAIGCSFPFTPLVEGFVWIPLIIIEQFWRQNFFDEGHPEWQVRLPATSATLQGTASVGAPDEAAIQDDPRLQEIFRVREHDGSESIYATVRAPFETDQRHATVHVGFCPPLEYLPEIEAATWDGPPCQVKVVQALAHGVRLDLKLADPAEEPFQLAVDLAARRPAEPRR